MIIRDEEKEDKEILAYGCEYSVLGRKLFLLLAHR